MPTGGYFLLPQYSFISALWIMFRVCVCVCVCVCDDVVDITVPKSMQGT